MRRLLIPLVLFAFVASALTGAGLSANSPAKGPLTFKVRLIQEATYRHPHPPAGDPGDTFSTTLRLFAIGNVLGFPNNTPMGTMAFTWGPLNGSCSSNAAACNGTTTILTTTKLPGGTITANGKNISLSNGIILPIQSGTGVFKGVKGKVFVAPGGNHVDIFKLVMP